MLAAIPYLILALCFGVFLYFGYRDDFRRDRKYFVKTILGVLILFSTSIIISKIDLPNWALILILGVLIVLTIFGRGEKKVEE